MVADGERVVVAAAAPGPRAAGGAPGGRAGTKKTKKNPKDTKKN